MKITGEMFSGMLKNFLLLVSLKFLQSIRDQSKIKPSSKRNLKRLIRILAKVKPVRKIKPREIKTKGTYKINLKCEILFDFLLPNNLYITFLLKFLLL